ncbi:serine hydrolase, partial [Francisella tularensis subsp. holarctica]|uniref:serine hydrolase n=1 Tax=Francisella tularensis TaxID=263 RepID=UPI0023AC48CB|nr:serine hydrolase [Francisella tularensis subsp. holarctica]
SLTTHEKNTTPPIMARDINKLAFSDERLDKTHRLMFKQWLKASNTSNNHIAADVPDELEVGDKNGTSQYGTTNYVAI